MFSLLKNTKISIGALKYNADNESLSGAPVDMTGFDSVAFIAFANSGEAFATHTIKGQMDDDTGFTDASTLASTAVTFSTTTAASGHGLTTLEIHHPSKRYVRPVQTVPNFSTARAVGCIAIQFNAKDLPYSANAGELHISPAAGAA